jgi:branched-subunit amino acid transport protein
LGTLWLIFLAAGLLTYLTRLSFIALLGKWQPPGLLQRALRFVPPAVLTAILFPELLIRQGNLIVSPANPRLVAGLVAALVAWRTKNVILTICVGMVALLGLQTIIG